MKDKFYVTTPIYYPNGKFHIGTAYTTILADVIARYYRLQNKEVRFLTGLDEHGLKIQLKAEEENITPQEFVDDKATSAKKLWELLNISNDDFIRTTEQRHINSVTKAFNKFMANGDIYKGKYSGKYCVPCESFYSRSQITDNLCPECGRKLSDIEEETYFFNMKKYQDKLLTFYKENPDFLQPESKKNEIMNSFLKNGIEDLCISRTSFTWGIKVPNDEKHVLYVWIDALLNYITALGYLSENDKLMEFWPADIQIIGKDILRFHAIYWPIFLMALDLPMPKKIFVHNFIMMKDGKMSKSKGNVIYPDILSNKYGVDAVRYTILKSMPYGQDGEFTPEYFIEKYNNDLCNDLGNLLNRTISMINKYQNGFIYKSSAITDFDEELINNRNNEVNEFEKSMESINIQGALTHIMNIVSRNNKYIDETLPWTLYKEGKTEELKSVLYNLYNNLRVVGILLSSFIPETSDKIFEQLGIKNQEQKSFDTIKEEIELEKNKVIELGIPLFNRLDVTIEIDKLKNLMKNQN